MGNYHESVRPGYADQTIRDCFGILQRCPQHGRQHNPFHFRRRPGGLIYFRLQRIWSPAIPTALTDIFVRNLGAAQTVRVSVSSTGVQGNEPSFQARISRDGGTVCFSSYATNLVTGDTNGQADIFIRNLAAGTTERVSLASDGSQADNYSWTCALSSNGRFVAFRSYATNLVPGDTNAKPDIFMRDRQTGQTTLVSKAVGGAQSDGIVICPAFRMMAAMWLSTLPPPIWWPAIPMLAMMCSCSIAIPMGWFGFQSLPVVSRRMIPLSPPLISADGRQVAFESIARNLISGDTNNNNDIYAHNLLTGKYHPGIGFSQRRAG